MSLKEDKWLINEQWDSGDKAIVESLIYCCTYTSSPKLDVPTLHVRLMAA